MVIRDPNLSEKEFVEQSQSMARPLSIASPTDRMAAAVIDYLIVLMPVIYLVMAPFQRAIKMAAIVDDQWSLTFSTLLSAMAVLVLILFYQAVCVWLWQATIGKFFLGLRVQHLWAHEKITFPQALHRAFYWLLSWVMMGAPFLSIFSNMMRRPLHDRASDTVVVSLREERAVSAPTIKESALVRGANWAVGIFAAMVLFSTILSMSGNLQKQSSLVSDLEEQDVLCAAVSEAQSEWPEENNKEAERMSVAMALFAAGTIDRQCLQSEVENLYTVEDESSLLYLAKSFVYAEQAELSDSYLDKVCEIASESEECRLSLVIQAVADDDWSTVKKSFNNIRSKDSVFASIWAIRQFAKHGDLRGAQDHLNQLPDIRSLVDFTAPMRAKILVGLNKNDEASGAEQVAYSSVSEEAKFDLASFMCFEKIWSNCSGKESHSCQTFATLAKQNPDALSGLKTSLTFLRVWECDQPDIKNYARLQNLPLHEDVKALVSALESGGTDGFSDLLDDSSADDEFSFEVSRRLVERTASRSLLKILYAEWAGKEHTSGWKKLGIALFEKFYGFKEYEDSIKVSDLLMKETDSQRVDKNIFEQIVVAAFRSGQRELAKKYFLKYAEIHPLPTMSAGRAPASASDFSEIIKQLMEQDQ